MLKRNPSSAPAGGPALTSATSGGFGLVSKPFKAPSALTSKRQLDLPPRKRKAISYKGQEEGNESDGSDAEARPSKKGRFAMGNKEYGEDGVLGDMARWCNRKFPVFKPKEKTAVFGST
jgi:DNA repair and recombination RAD54-like protein